MTLLKITTRIALCALAVLFFAGKNADAPAQDSSAPTAQEAAQPQETPPAATPAPTQEKSLDELLAEWSAIDLELKAAETAARADGAPEATRRNYIDLVDRANKLIEQIQTAAVSALAKDPANEKATKTILGIMLNGSRNRTGDRNVLTLADQLMAAGVSPELLAPLLASPRLSPFGKELFDEISIRMKEHQAGDLPQVKLTTSKGEIVLELFENEAPNSVANFVSLVKAKFYDGLKFHRVIEGFMAQGGCPKGDGSSGPGYSIKCECYEPNNRKHFSGSLSMAHAGRDTGGSQFFITFSATSQLDGRHTVFGRVVSGMDVLDKLTRNASDVGPIPGVEADTIISAEVLRDRGHDYAPVKIGEQKPEESESKQ